MMTPFTILKTAAAMVIGFVVMIPILLLFWLVILLDPSYGNEFVGGYEHPNAYPSKYEYIGSLPKSGK